METPIKDYKQTIEAYVSLIKENQRLLAENEKLNKFLDYYKDAIEELGYGLFDEDVILGNKKEM
jgi:cell division septum initiation protein DivIVA